ncbi:MAG: EAL domain-containing protein [Pseudomonadota bacterium]
MGLAVMRRISLRQVIMLSSLMALTLLGFLIASQAIDSGRREAQALQQLKAARFLLDNEMRRSTELDVSTAAGADARTSAATRLTATWERFETVAEASIGGSRTIETDLDNARAVVRLRVHQLRENEPAPASALLESVNRFAVAVDAVVADQSDRLEAAQRHALHRGKSLAILTLLVLAAEAAMLIRPLAGQLAMAEATAVEATERLSYLASHDELTGLANRRALENELQRRMTTAAPFGLVLCDLDGFKPINDVYGHAAGDTVLRAAAGRLDRALRPGDIAARLGGDEFVLVVGGDPEGDPVGLVARRVQAALAMPISHEDHQLTVGASVGTAVHPQDGATPHALLAAADAAMYEAKQTGGAVIRSYTNRLRQYQNEREAIRRDLQLALKTGALYVVFQPQISLRDGRHQGFEALARWHSDERGAVAPGVFMPIAEEAGLMAPLTDRLLDSIATALGAWLDQGLEPSRVWLNVSGPSLARDDVVGRLRRLCRRCGLEPRLLGVEVGEEGVSGRGAEAALETLQALKDQGFGVAIDDFGTGCASLTSLRTVPFDRLKLSGALIASLGEDRTADALVKTLVELSSDVGGRAVASQVETAAQLAALARLGCHEAQGFALQPPLATVEAATYMQQRTRRLAAVSQH